MSFHTCILTVGYVLTVLSSFNFYLPWLLSLQITIRLGYLLMYFRNHLSFQLKNSENLPVRLLQ